MKVLKVTLILALFFVSLTSCTKQDLTEDDVLQNPDTEFYATGGQVDEKG
jgi:outer membrane protein assembly factor BamD (BamD/ComL family)